MKPLDAIADIISGPSLEGAACTGKAPLFDARADGEPRDTYLRRYRHAASICRTCPVLERCDQAATAAPPGQCTGIWAERRFGRGA
ncbi:WhiB family transcriptional regulator [Dietzia maris]|uniref:WhiB family transcriptional regulator n=1 Tax=Dietzia maris TaxID=37915 RepID=UPI00344EF415